jgi:hypothetical protein
MQDLKENPFKGKNPKFAKEALRALISKKKVNNFHKEFTCEYENIKNKMKQI